MGGTEAEVHAYRVEMVLTEDRTLTLDNLPFEAGDAVEVIILPRPAVSAGQEKYPLRGQPIRHDRPTDPVAEKEWDAARWSATNLPATAS
jgi:hypothetical protein